MSKKVILGGLLASLLLLTACQKSETPATEEAVLQSSSTPQDSTNHPTSSTMERQSKSIDASDQAEGDIRSAKEQLIGNRFLLAPSLYDGIDATEAMNEQKAPQNLMHDGFVKYSFKDDSTAHVELAGTYRPDHDASYTLTTNKIIIENQAIPYTLKNGIISFDSWTTDMAGHTITWSFKPEEESHENTTTQPASESAVDTKNLTAEQMKAWVGAVLDKQFALGRTSIPYRLSVENIEGYACVRVNHSELQVDTVTVFRVNGEGQLEELDRSNDPATYHVVSKSFMDTSEVTYDRK